MMEEYEFTPSKINMILEVIIAPIFGLIPGLFLIAISSFLWTFKPGMAALILKIGIALIVILPLWRIVYLFVHFPMIRYEIKENFITSTEGVLWKENRTISYDKITHVVIRQGPIDRLLNIGDVLIHTPGSMGVTPEVEFMGIKNPKEIKDIIVSRINIFKGK